MCLIDSIRVALLQFFFDDDYGKLNNTLAISYTLFRQPKFPDVIVRLVPNRSSKCSEETVRELGESISGEAFAEKS